MPDRSFTDAELADLLEDHPPAVQVVAAEAGRPMVVTYDAQRPVAVIARYVESGEWLVIVMLPGAGRWTTWRCTADMLVHPPSPEPPTVDVTVTLTHERCRAVAGDGRGVEALRGMDDFGAACRAAVAELDDPGDEDSGLQLADVQAATDALTSHRASATTAVPDPPEVREVVQALNLVPAGCAIPLAAFDAVEALAERGWIDADAVGEALRGADRTDPTGEGRHGD